MSSKNTEVRDYTFDLGAYVAFSEVVAPEFFPGKANHWWAAFPERCTCHGLEYWVVFAYMVREDGKAFRADLLKHITTNMNGAIAEAARLVEHLNR